MRVVVTGAAGYLGVNLVGSLVADGHSVRAIDREIPSGSVEGVEWCAANVLDAAAMRSLFDGQDVVFHLAARISLAAEDPAVWELNVRGVGVVAEAALTAGVPRFVHCSSVHAFDTTATGEITESSARATSAALPIYDRSKYAGERELRKRIDRGLNAVILNPTGIYGPADHPSNLSRMNGMLRDAARGRVPVDMSGGFDWVDVRDVVRTLIAAADTGAIGENYLVGGHFLTMHDAFSTAARVVGRRAPMATLPLGVLAALLPLAEPITKRLGSDVFSEAAIASLVSSPKVRHDKAAQELGHVARPSTETIRDLVAFFVQSGLLDRGRVE